MLLFVLLAVAIVVVVISVIVLKFMSSRKQKEASVADEINPYSHGIPVSRSQVSAPEKETALYDDWDAPAVTVVAQKGFPSKPVFPGKPKLR